MKRKILKTSIIALISSMFLGCATLMAPKTQPLPVSSEPSGSEVYINGIKMGTTPVLLSLKADKSYIIEFRKEGYESVTRVINTKVDSKWLVLDIFCGLFPVLIDAATGAWKTFDQDAVDAALIEQKK
jgi:hypothetical protein